MKPLIAKVLTGVAATAGLMLSTAPAFAFDPVPFKQFVTGERGTLDPTKVKFYELDPTKLTLMYDHDVTTYFIGEGARNRNQLGVTATGTTEIAPTILYDDIVCLTEECATLTAYKRPDRTSSTIEKGGLTAGEAVSLGTVKAGTTLDFWLKQDGFNRNYNGGDNAKTLYGDASKNADGQQHLMAYEYGNYLVLAWEDLLVGEAGADFDYNDVIFAVDIGEANLKKIREESGVKQAPEPSTAAALIGLSAFAASRLRRKRNA
jgi:Domain of unknown function (DUF4114)